MAKVLVLSLEDYSWLDEMYANFTQQLKDRATPVNCNSKADAFEQLKDSSIKSILVYEPSVMQKKNDDLGKAIAEWTRAGGTTVFGACCSSFVAPNLLKAFFAKHFDQPWKGGSYHRTTFAANPALRLSLAGAHVPSVSMKALHLAGVATEDAVYLPTSESRIESNVFPPERVQPRGEAPVVFAQHGDGKVGWVGDVNNEPEHIPVVLAMLGV